MGSSHDLALGVKHRNGDLCAFHNLQRLREFRSTPVDHVHPESAQSPSLPRSPLLEQRGDSHCWTNATLSELGRELES